MACSPQPRAHTLAPEPVAAPPDAPLACLPLLIGATDRTARCRHPDANGIYRANEACTHRKVRWAAAKKRLLAHPSKSMPGGSAGAGQLHLKAGRRCRWPPALFGPRAPALTGGGLQASNPVMHLFTFFPAARCWKTTAPGACGCRSRTCRVRVTGGWHVCRAGALPSPPSSPEWVLKACQAVRMGPAARAPVCIAATCTALSSTAGRRWRRSPACLWVITPALILQQLPPRLCPAPPAHNALHPPRPLPCPPRHLPGWHFWVFRGRMSGRLVVEQDQSAGSMRMQVGVWKVQHVAVAWVYAASEPDRLIKMRGCVGDRGGWWWWWWVEAGAPPHKRDCAAINRTTHAHAPNHAHAAAGARGAQDARRQASACRRPASVHERAPAGCVLGGGARRGGAAARTADWR